MSKEGKRIGRPPKPAPKGRRVSLGLKVGADVKKRLDSAARASGRTQSQEVERRIEMSYSYERAIGAAEMANAILAQLRESNTEEVLRKLGWNEVPDLRWGGPVWLPPGRLLIEQTRWEDPNVHTPPTPPKLIPDPQFMQAIAQAIAPPVVEAIKAGLVDQGRGSS